MGMELGMGDVELKLDRTVSHVSYATQGTNATNASNGSNMVTEKLKNISVKISENPNNPNTNDNGNGNIESKLDLIMSENNLEIHKQSNAAHEILNKYTNKFDDSIGIGVNPMNRMVGVANSVAEEKNEKSKKTKKSKRDSATKNVTLNTKVKFPSLVDLSTKTATHAHVPPNHNNSLAIANAASKSGSYINESKLSSSEYSASNAINSTGYLNVLNNLNNKRNAGSNKKTSQSTTSLSIGATARPLGWKRNEI